MVSSPDHANCRGTWVSRTLTTVFVCCCKETSHQKEDVKDGLVDYYQVLQFYSQHSHASWYPRHRIANLLSVRSIDGPTRSLDTASATTEQSGGTLPSRPGAPRRTQRTWSRIHSKPHQQPRRPSPSIRTKAQKLKHCIQPFDPNLLIPYFLDWLWFTFVGISWFEECCSTRTRQKSELFFIGWISGDSASLIEGVLSKTQFLFISLLSLRQPAWVDQPHPIPAQIRHLWGNRIYVANTLERNQGILTLLSEFEWVVLGVVG